MGVRGHPGVATCDGEPHSSQLQHDVLRKYACTVRKVQPHYRRHPRTVAWHQTCGSEATRPTVHWFAQAHYTAVLQQGSHKSRKAQPVQAFFAGGNLHSLLYFNLWTLQVNLSAVLQVYGETSFELVRQMVQSLDFSGDDVFIDLGSGKYFSSTVFCDREIHV